MTAPATPATQAATGEANTPSMNRSRVRAIRAAFLTSEDTPVTASEFVDLLGALLGEGSNDVPIFRAQVSTPSGKGERSEAEVWREQSYGVAEESLAFKARAEKAEAERDALQTERDKLFNRVVDLQVAECMRQSEAQSDARYSLRSAPPSPEVFCEGMLNPEDIIEPTPLETALSRTELGREVLRCKPTPAARVTDAMSLDWYNANDCDAFTLFEVMTMFANAMVDRAMLARRPADVRGEATPVGYAVTNKHGLVTDMITREEADDYVAGKTHYRVVALVPIPVPDSGKAGG